MYTKFNAVPHFQHEGPPIDRSANYVAAVVRLQTKAPALHSLLMHNVGLIATSRIPTAATCGFYLYINMEFFNHTLVSVEERTAVLAHEMMHVVLRHGLRGMSYRKQGHGPNGSTWNPRLYNEAADYVINADLKWMRMDLSRVGWLLDPRFTRDDLVDAVYLKLLEEQGAESQDVPPPDVPTNPGPSGDATESGDDAEGEGEGADGDDADADGDEADGEGGGSGSSQDADDSESEGGDGDGEGEAEGEGESDGQSDGHGEPSDTDSDSISSGHGGHDEHLEPLYDGTPAEQEQQRREDEQSLKDAVEAAMDVAEKAVERGDADYTAKPSANMARNARSGDRASSTDWRTELQDYLLASGRGGDTNWNRINRKRFSTLGIVAPTYRGTCSQLVVTVDISGSVSQSSLDKFLIECAQAIDILKPTSGVLVLWTREYVFATNEINTGDELLNLARPSCGGTYMTAAVEWIEDNGIIPDLHLIFTDGYMDDEDYRGVAQGENVVMVFDRDIETNLYVNRKVQASGVRYVCVKD